MIVLICLDMKQIFLILSVIIISTIVLQGCVDQNNSGPKLVTAPLNTLGLKSNELPDNVVKLNEVFNDTEVLVEFSDNVTAILLEKYGVDYSLKEPQSFLTLDMKKLNSTDETKEQFERERSDLSDLNYEIVSEEKIGDESVVGRLNDYYLIIFRKYNVVSRIYPVLSHDLTIQDFINYAKIIVNHIESSV